MSQSRSASLIEAATNVTCGLVVSWAITVLVLPVWGFEPSLTEALEITAVYTVASLIRSYGVRRAGEWVQRWIEFPKL